MPATITGNVAATTNNIPLHSNQRKQQTQQKRTKVVDKIIKNAVSESGKCLIFP